MFFRLKPTKTGQVLKLIESYRDSSSVPRHRTVVSLGNAPLERADWKPVAKAVEDLLYKGPELFPRALTENQAAWVDRIIKQVNTEGKWHPYMPARKNADVIDGVVADKVTHTCTAELGTVLIGLTAWQRLGMPELLQSLDFNNDQVLSAAISVINRLVDPSSEHSLLDWYRCTGLPELMGNSLRGAGDDRFYRVSDRLLANKNKIEQHLRDRQMSLFNLERTVFLYDLTNSHFEGLCKHNPKAKRGKNKQKRNDCPQIVVGMVFDQYGFELAHKVFDGNQSDSKSLLEMIEELNASVPTGNAKPLIIMDAGVATAANLTLLREHGFGYLVNDTRNRRKDYLEYFLEDEEFSVVPDRLGKPPVLVRLMDDVHSEQSDTSRDRVVLCKSEQRGQKENAILSNAEKRFLDDINKLAKRIQKGQLKDLAKINRSIGRLSANHTRVNRFYTITLDEANQIPELRWERNDEKFDQASRLWGCYVLRTDDRTLDKHEYWKLYIGLTQAEAGFKSLKTDLGLRPNPHHKEDRVDGHVFICIIAYHLLKNILWTLEQKEDTRSWETIKRIMSTHCYTTILLPTKDGLTHRIRKAGQPEECQKEIYQALGIEWRNLPSHRTTVGDNSKIAQDNITTL
ncbi:MAG: IS1634 family transposase [Lentisphaerae bacterium]|nr:IS1634 family transposase [Lentisphaerota bacterium]